MTTPLRDRITRLIATLAFVSAIALPRAAAAEDTELDKMRAKVAALVGNMMELAHHLQGRHRRLARGCGHGPARRRLQEPAGKPCRLHGPSDPRQCCRGEDR